MIDRWSRRPRAGLLACAASALLAWAALAVLSGAEARADAHAPGEAAPKTAAGGEDAGAPEAQGPMGAGEWIARSNEALFPSDTMTATVKIVTHDGHGGEDTLVLDMARDSDRGIDRTLFEVRAPEEGAGAVYEFVSKPDGTFERWAWLPEVRRLREIRGVQRTDHFLGTEFTYEDLSLAMPVERGEGSVRWEGPDGHVIIESRPYHFYGRVVTRIDPQTHLPVRITFYDRAGQDFRVQHFEDVQTVEGHPYPMRIRAEDRLTDARSVLTFESVAFDPEIPDARFGDSELRRRMPKP